ncbi:MAG: glycerophosphodiester phosphodiesterase family protein [Pseudomonadota bacterium]
MSGPKDFLQRFGWTGWPEDALPVAIAHRGASDYAPENTLKAFRIAHELGAEMWELDVRLAACGTVVVSHDASLERVAGDARPIASTTAKALKQTRLPDGEQIPTLSEVIALAEQTGTALYIELKDAQSGPATWQLLNETGFKRAVIGAFDPTWIKPLRDQGCDWPLSVLVPKDKDPLAYAALAKPDIIHLCWEKAAPRPDTLLTEDLIAAIHATGAAIVAWHEERTEVAEALRSKPLLGICSNRSEMLKLARHSLPIATVCHRGANSFAPENTLEAARICFDQRLDFVELDVRTTKDGHLVVMHDATLERTTNGTGLVTDLTLDDVRSLDAGSWFSETFAGTKVPTLLEILTLARDHPYAGAGIYIEIKYASPRQILDEILATGMQDRVFLWGSDIDALEWLRAQSDDLQLMAPVWLYGSVEKAHAHYGAQIIEFDVTRDDLDQIALCKSLGLKSMIYSQTHDWDELSSYLKYKPDLVNLDRPDRFKLLADYAWRERGQA